MKKSIFVSRTFWMNLLVGVVAVAGGAQLGVPTQYAVPAVAVANILLRLITSQPVGIKSGV